MKSLCVVRHKIQEIQRGSRLVRKITLHQKIFKSQHTCDNLTVANREIRLQKVNREKVSILKYVKFGKCIFGMQL